MIVNMIVSEKTIKKDPSTSGEETKDPNILIESFVSEGEAEGEAEGLVIEEDILHEDAMSTKDAPERP